MCERKTKKEQVLTLLKKKRSLNSDKRGITFKSENLGEFDLNTKNNRGQESGDQVGTDNENNHSSEISLKKTFYM